MTADAPPTGSRVADATCTAAARALLDAGLDAAYQPIVHLGSGAVLAYEALARPRHPDGRNPMAFFAALERAGLRLAGERAAFAAAIAGAGDLPGTKLFVNASPRTLVDPAFDVAELVGLAEVHGLAPADLVIEVTESEEIEDLDALAERVRRLHRVGVGLAVDDAGAGHASFKVITRLRPSFIKLDRDLVTGVDLDGARYAFIESMVRFARQIGSRLIAEGVETEGELACLAGLNVEAAQGYYLARPEIGRFADPSADARRTIRVAADRLGLGAALVTARELARPAADIAPGEPLAAAAERFAAEPHLGLLLVRDGGRLTGQLTRASVEGLLAAHGAWARHAGEPVRTVVDHDPLTVGADLDVTEVARILAARPGARVVDDVVVTDVTGEAVGVVTVRDVMRVLAHPRETAGDDLNPLSGLPGSGWVERELRRRAEDGEQVTALFLDVDRLSDLNHLGGYALGDEVIRKLARCLTGVAAGVLDATAAHAGADDFVLLVPARGYEELIAEVVRSVEGEVMPYVRMQLHLCGKVEIAEDIAVSMAAVPATEEVPPGHGHLDWARHRVAPLMRLAKESTGYACVHASAGSVQLTTWNPEGSRRRSISFGQAEPHLVLAALELIDRSWRSWWEEREGGEHTPLGRFPGPRSVVERLQVHYGASLARAAIAAMEAGRSMVDLVLEGEEAEILGMLDRLVLVTASLYERRCQRGPEVALIERILHHRARALTRRDRIVPAQAVG